MQEIDAILGQLARYQLDNLARALADILQILERRLPYRPVVRIGLFAFTNDVFLAFLPR